MIIIMEHGATEEQVENVIEKLVDLGFTIHRSTGAVHTVLGPSVRTRTSNLPSSRYCRV